jgi:hypothetical protein
VVFMLSKAIYDFNLRRFSLPFSRLSAQSPKVFLFGWLGACVCVCEALCLYYTQLNI